MRDIPVQDLVDEIDIAMWSLATGSGPGPRPRRTWRDRLFELRLRFGLGPRHIEW